MSTEAPWDGRINRGQWLVLAAAVLGWMFDGVEIGLAPLMGRPALIELLGRAGRPAGGALAGRAGRDVPVRGRGRRRAVRLAGRPVRLRPHDDLQRADVFAVHRGGVLGPGRGT